MGLPFYPSYDTNNKLYYFFWIFLVLYAVGAGAVLLVFVMNNSVPFTWFKNPSTPGAFLYSARGLFLDVSVRLMIIGHLMYCGLLLMFIIGRQNYGCNIVLMILFAVVFLFTIFALASLGEQYNTCNQQNQYGNMCNDANYCNVNEIRINPANGCPNPAPSPTPVLWQSLGPNSNFLGLFWTNFALCIMQLIFVGVIMWAWFTSPDASEEEPEKAVIVTPSAPPPPQEEVKFKIGSSIKTHGLKERKGKKISNNE